jgi:hypothetical protein
MRLLGKVEGAIIGAVILTLGMSAGWNLRHKPAWLLKYDAAPPPVFCIVKGAAVTCGTAPPAWRGATAPPAADDFASVFKKMREQP